MVMVDMIYNRVIIRVWNVVQCHQPMDIVVFGNTPDVEYDHPPPLAGPGILFEYSAFAVSHARLFVAVLPDINGVV